MGMRIIFSIVIVILLFSCKEDPVTTPTNDPQELNIAKIDAVDKIEVVTWNVERFPKADHSDEYLEQFIDGLNADVYLLQEIQNNSKFGEVIGNLDDYSYFLQSNSTGQKLAIVYKNNVISLKSTQEILIADDHYFASRPPFLSNIEWSQGGVTKELFLLNIHYKCCGDDSIDVGNIDDQEYRRWKANDLMYNYILDNMSDKNVIAVGDWNDAIEEPKNTNVFQMFIDDNANFQFVDMNIAQGSANNWSWQGWNSSYSAIHFDHILINANLFDEYQNNSEVNVIKAEEYFEDGSSDYDAYLSDHRPVYFQFTP